jgi:hypothetical protein
MPLTNYKQVQDFITTILTQHNQMNGAKKSPHKDFWNSLSYNDFVNGSIPGVEDPDTGAPVPILIKGNSADSNLILSLRGMGPLFDPDSGAFGQMPANGPPMFTAAQIKELADWIDAGCPQ